MTKEIHILKVQLAEDGHVWHAAGVDTPAASGYSCDGFVSRLIPNDGLHVRVIGTVANAPLIAALYQARRASGNNWRLEVASPTVCETSAERRDPTIALCRMRQCLLPPSLGGWHPLTSLDYPSYALASQFMATVKNTQLIEQLLATHPVYHDLLFLPTLQHLAVAELLGVILDPRWFVDCDNPYRLSRLKLYLGLTPRTMRQAMTGYATCERSRRCRLALTAWGGCGVSPNRSDYERPGNFLWRRWQDAGGGVMGNLRATQAFITYFVRTWQQQLVSKSAQTHEMFIAEELLKGNEVPAYKDHAKRRSVICE